MELITDYTVWLAHHPEASGLDAYDPVERLNTLYRQRLSKSADAALR